MAGQHHHAWVSFLHAGRPSTEVKRATDLASGAYAIRRKDSHGVVYVGESNLGHMWRTICRHFQAPATFTARKKPGAGNAFATDTPGDYEVTWQITSRGKREKKHGDQKAMALQAKWIAKFRKSGHRLHNRDDGLANATVEREYRAAQAKHAEEADAWGGLLNPGNPPIRGTTGEIMREWKGLRDGDVVRAGKRTGRFLGATWASRAVGGKRAARAIVLWDGATKETLADPSTLAKVNPGDFAGGGRASIHAMKKELKDLEAAWAAHLRDPDRAKHREDGKAIMNKIADLKEELSDATKNARGPRGKRANPDAPRGTLTELGRLTRMSLWGAGERFLVWPLRDAPILAYDKSGRLHVVYMGRVVRPSTAAECSEYERTHWGASGRGKVNDGGVAVPPWVTLGIGKSITYTTRKGVDSEGVDYVHPWGEGGPKKFTPPIVREHRCKGGCAARCAARGALALSGGSYTVSERGIVG